MAQVNKYADKSAYNGDANRNKNKSAVSHIEANGANIYDGVNIVVDKPHAGEGDLVVFDKIEGRKRFVKHGTVKRAAMPAHLVPISVVLFRRGDLVYHVTLQSLPNQRWAHPFEVAINGVNGAIAGTMAITVQDVGNGKEETVNITYNAGAELSAIAVALNAEFAKLTDEDNKRWTASGVGTQIIISHNYSTKGIVTGITGTGGASGVTYVSDDVDYQNDVFAINTGVEYVRRKNGVGISWAGCHLKKFVEYYSVNGTTPTSNVPLHSGTVVNRDAFENSEFCADLRAAYADYAAYMDGGHVIDRLSLYSSHKRDGKTNTAILAGLKGTTVRGADEPRYLAADSAHNYAVHIDGFDDDVVGLGVGAWWLPDNMEMTDMISPRRLNAADKGTFDPVNDTLLEMGGSPIYGSDFYPWTSCEYSQHRAFVFSGDDGTLTYVTKSNSYPVRPVSAF